MPETFDILTAIKSVYPSLQRDFRRVYPKAQAEELDGMIGRLFYDTMFRPEKNTDPQARQKFIAGLSRSPQIPEEWKSDQLTLVKNVTQEAFRFTPKATYEEQEPLKPLLEKVLPIEKEKKAREAELLKELESYPKVGTREAILKEAKIAQLEKAGKFEGLAKDLTFVADTWRNVFGQHLVGPAATVAAQAGIPGAEQVAIAVTPRVNFAREIEKKYGPWAVIPYTVAEVALPFALGGGAFTGALGVASRLPGAAGRVAQFTLTHPTLYNAYFLGGYSYSDAAYQKKQIGEKLTGKEALVSIGAGALIGVGMPHIGKVFEKVAVKKEFGENIEMLLGKKVSQLRRMTDPQLRKLIRESHLPQSIREKTPPELLEKLRLPENLLVKRIKDLNKRGAVTQFLGQSFRSGAVGSLVQVGQDLALGLPINAPNIAHNAVTMMTFHASGLAPYIPRAMKPKDGIADLSTPQGKGILGKSIKFLLSNPDMPPEQMQTEFVKNLTKNKVEAIRTVDGDIIKPKEVFEELNKATEPGSQSLFNNLALAYREYGRAMVTAPRTGEVGALNRLEVRTVTRSRIDDLIATVGRKLGESTDVPSTAKPEVSALRLNEDLYESKLKKIADEFGQEGVDTVVESLRTGVPLSKMGTPVAQEIANRYREMRSLIDNFRRATSEKVSAKEVQQQILDLREQEEGKQVEAAPLQKEPPKSFILEKENALADVRGFLEAGREEGTPRTEVYQSGDWIVEHIGEMGGKPFFNLFKIGKSVEKGTLLAEIDGQRIEVGGTYGDTLLKNLGIKVETPTKIKPPEERLQPKWVNTATDAQYRAIVKLREEKSRNVVKYARAIQVAKEQFEDIPKKEWPPEIAEAERLLGIEKEKKRKVAPSGRYVPKSRTEPEEISKRVEEADAILSEGGIEEAEIAFNDIYKTLHDAPLADARTKEAKNTLSLLNDFYKKLSKEVDNRELNSFLAQEHQKVGNAVEHLGEVGIIARGLKGEEYIVYFPMEDVATPVNWTQAQPSTLKETVKLAASLDRLRTAAKESGMSESEIETFIDAVEGNGKLGIVIGVDTGELAKLAGKAASKVADLFRKKPSSVVDLANSVELYRHRRYQRRYGSVMARFFQFAFFGDPMKDATAKQVKDIERAIEQNQDNPFMGAEPHLIDPTDFMVKVLGRTNWSRIMAKEAGQPYQPLNRLDAQKLLKEFAKISVAIRNKNFALASNIGLPLAISESTPRTRQAFEGMTGATFKRNARIAELYELLNDINVVADRKARKFINPNTGNNINREVADILQGFVKPNDPNLMKESRDIASLFRSSRFRERFWEILNNVHNFRTLRILRGSLMNDRSKFIDYWIERGLASEKVTPENAEATRDRLETEAGRIFDNPEKRKEIIDRIIDESKLGKIISKQGMNLYYPGIAKKLNEVLREKAEKLEAGEYVKGGYGGIIFEHARNLTLEERQAHPELYKEPNVVDDFLTYGLDVLNLAYRADMDFYLWRATKQIELDMEKAPKYANRFAHDMQFIESMRDALLNPPKNPGRRIGGNIAALTAAAILPRLRTVVRNLTGGTGLTYIWTGSKSMARAWETIREGEYRGIPLAKIERPIGAGYQELIEGGLAKVPTRPTEVMPKGFEQEMNLWASAVTQYSLSRIVPGVPDVWPWFAQVTRRMTFAGSEELLRRTAGMAGFVSTFETILSEGSKYRRKVRIFANSAPELIQIAKQKYGETVSESFVRSQLKATKSPKAQNKYALDLSVKENDRQLNQRAFREAIKGARETIMWTQFLYGGINTPKVMRNPLGRVILVLRKYTWNKAMVGLRILRELDPKKGGGAEEWARFMRYITVVGVSTALSNALRISIARYFDDDILNALGSVKAMIDGVPAEEAFWGAGPVTWLSGAVVGRNMNILAAAQGERAGPEMDKNLEVILTNTPYGQGFIDAWREYVKVTENGKNVFEALANNLIGLMREYEK